jgi:hypothetical protein
MSKWTSFKNSQLMTESWRRFLNEAPEAHALKGFGSSTATKSAQARGGLERAKAIAKGDTLGDVNNKERAMLVQIEKALTGIAEKDDLVKYRSVLQSVLQKLLASAEKAAPAGTNVEEK